MIIGEKSKLFMALLLTGLTTNSIASPKYIPVANGLFSTGQWYFEGTRSALGGNAFFNFVPALQFSDQLTLIPSIETNYRGTRSAEELAGGNTLFQDTWENAVSVKAVHSLSTKWSIKERLGGRMKWFRETSNESWSNGLYDYNSVTVGAEVERKSSKKSSVSLGYDFSLLAFPNYESLESSQSGENAREFSGSKVLNSQVHLLSLRWRTPLASGIRSVFSAFYNPRYYDDQQIVQLSGLFSSESRSDVRTGGQVTLDREFSIRSKARIIPSLMYGYTMTDSNQNHYDARQTTFIANYYDSRQHTAGVNLALAFGNKNAGAYVIESGFQYEQKNYTDRVIQNEAGAYLTDKLYIRETNFNVAFSYPLSKYFRARLSSSFGKSKSNNQYESVYRYNYDNANYQFGFTYDY